MSSDKLYCVFARIEHVLHLTLKVNVNLISHLVTNNALSKVVWTV